MNYKRPRLWGFVFLIIIVTVVGIGLMVNPINTAKLSYAVKKPGEVKAFLEQKFGSITEEGLSARRPMIMVNNKIYMDTGREILVEINDNKALGAITSSVKSTEIPAHNGESNFGKEGAQYAFYNESLVVLLENKWILFEEEVDTRSVP